MNWERCGFVVYHKQMEKGCSVLKSYEQVLDFMNFLLTKRGLFDVCVQDV